MGHTHVACLQFAPKFGDPKANLETIRSVVAREAADLWVLPELALTGYDFRDAEETRRLAEPTDGPSVTALVDLARSQDTHLVVGFAERAGDRVYNAAVLVGPGGLMGLYRKVHLFDREKELFAPGDLGFPVFETPFGRVGLMICFDWIFPEAARSLAVGGADLIAHPANLVLPYCQDALVTRALENRLFIAMANRTGTEEHVPGRKLTFTGRSRILDPSGRVLAEGPPYDGTETDESREGSDVAVIRAVVDLDSARDKWITEQNHVFDERRPDQYRM